MIQFPGKNHDGSFALHKVTVGNSKYSAYYNADGSLKGADRVSWVGGIYRTFNVAINHRLVRNEIETIGRRYAGR